MNSSQHSSPEARREIVLSSTNNANFNQVFCLEPANSKPQGPSEDKLSEFWDLIRFRWATVLFIILSATIASAIYTLKQPPTYQAIATIELESASQNPVNRIGDVDLSAPVASADFVQTQIKLLQSRTLRQRVIAKLQATKRNPFERHDQISAWCQALRLKWCVTPRATNMAMAPVSIEAKDPDGSRIIEIRADSADPDMAADFANTLAAEYQEQNMESRWNAAQGASGFLTRQLEELKAKLQQSERALLEYSRATGLLYTDDKSSVQGERLKELQEELSKSQAERIAKEAMLRVATDNPVESLPQIIDNARLSGEQTKLADLKRQLAELGTTFTPEYYKVVRVQAQIDELQASLQKERADILKRIRVDYDSALLREKLVANQYARQAGLVSNLDGKAIYYSVLKQEVNTTRGLYDTLLQKMKEFEVASALRASNVRVVDPALRPPAPYKPDLPRNIAMGSLSGLMLAISFVLLRERTDRSIKAPGEAHFHLKLRELGVIPSSIKGRLPGVGRENGQGALVALDLNGNVVIGERDRVELVTWQDKTSPVAESFRNTLASILFSQQDANRPRVILITSPGRAEGKSTTASNLAIALAEINQRVLLIDADIRKSSLHKLFDVSNSWGLSDLLRERAPLQDCPLEALARRTAIEGLHVLPCGPGILNISSLLYSGRMVELLQRTRMLFDTIVIDTPPILYVSDSRILARLADAAVLVVRAGVTTRDAAIAAKERFDNDGIPLLGVVLNDWDLKSKSAHSYGAYEYGYENRAAWDRDERQAKKAKKPWEDRT